MRMQRCFFVILLSLFIVSEGRAKGKYSREDSLLLSRVFAFAAHTDTTGLAGSRAYAYQRFLISADRRNALLKMVPTMRAISHGKTRQYAGELYNEVEMLGLGKTASRRMLSVSTIPGRRRAFNVLLQYLTPNIYNETILEDYLLSPFYRTNRHFYRYKFVHIDNQRTKIIFKSRVDNTQLVSGRAIVDNATGRVISTDLYGELDMVHFRLSLEMGQEGHSALFPVSCRLKSMFKFIGSKVLADYLCHYGPEELLADTLVADSLSDEERFMLIEQIRPTPLTDVEQDVFDKYFDARAQQLAAEAQADTPAQAEKARKHQMKHFWGSFGDHILNRTKSTFGADDQGYLRISPIFNPLYFGYSNNKGFVYKFDVRTRYDFTPNRDVTLRIKTGYSFKLRQPYVKVPFRFNYNKRRHAHLGIDFDYGRRVYNGEVMRDVNPVIADSLKAIGKRLDYFRDTYLHIFNNYDISDQWSFNVGFVHHKREAVHPDAFAEVGQKTHYRSTAPCVEWQYRPLGWRGPAITLDYERGIKGLLRSDAEYERWEVDGSYKYPLPCMQTVSMRLGGGVYTKRECKQYFLDFTNFRDDNIPGGWNDEWTGEFKMLRSSWYNSSRYYLRANCTYESPLLMMSHVPLIGHFMEMERLYAGFVWADELKPYFEIGYGFTTRWLSLGTFVGNRNGHFERVGARVGVELFRKW